MIAAAPWPIRALLLASLILPSASNANDPLPVRIIDGDTIEVAGERIRLWGIDAPELRQMCAHNGLPLEAGEWSAVVLRLFVWRDTVECEALYRDRYGRTVARCEARGEDLGELMVRSGWAWDWPRYSGGAYAEAEAEARENHRGLWLADDCAPRWLTTP